MPRLTLHQKPGQAIMDPMRQLLLSLFEAEEIDKIETIGGTIEILVSTSPRGVKRQKELKVDSEYLKSLCRLSADTDDLNNELVGLTMQQLRVVCNLLSLPASKSLKKRDLIGSIRLNLKSRESWDAIIGKVDESHT